MRKNKLGLILALIMMLFVCVSQVNADSLADTKRFSDVYKASDDSSEFKFPFVRISNGRMDIDKEINQDGVFFTNSVIEVNSNLKGNQIFYSTDTIRINANIENAVIYTVGNVIITGEVERTTIVYAGTGVIIEDGANVKGNLIVYTPSLTVNSDLDCNIYGTASTFNLNKSVKGAVRVLSNTVNVAEGVTVDGQLYVKTPNKDLTLPEGFENGTIELTGSQESTSTKVKNYFKLLIGAVIGDLVVCLLALLIIKKDKLAKIPTKVTNGRKAILNGIVSLLVMVLSVAFGIAMVLFLTKLGVALIVFGLSFAVIAALLKNAILVIFITEMALDRFDDTKVKPNRILTAIFEIIILEVLETIPFIGVLINAFVFILATGMFVSLLQGPKEEKHEIIHAK